MCDKDSAVKADEQSPVPITRGGNGKRCSKLFKSSGDGCGGDVFLKTILGGGAGM